MQPSEPAVIEWWASSAHSSSGRTSQKGLPVLGKIGLSSTQEVRLTIDVNALKGERDSLRESLKALENEQRQLEAQQKKLRQREIRTKRTLEALETLIDLGPTSNNENPE